MWLRQAGVGILVKDASLGGEYPVMNVTLLNPHDQGCFASFGAHPRFEIALERALTELLQGRGLDALGGFPEPGFDLDEIAKQRASWGLFRDRRPDLYGPLTGHDAKC